MPSAPTQNLALRGDAQNGVPIISATSPASVFELTPRPNVMPPGVQSFIVDLAPRQFRHYDAIGNFVYVATTTAELEIAIDDGVSYMPWDAAMALNYSGGNSFRRISLRNPSDTRITGILYIGAGVSVTDHRLHTMGDLRVNPLGQMTNAFEGTMQPDETWQRIAGTIGSRREIWLAVERLDGVETDIPRAWWRSGSLDDAKTPPREIGMALDGITKLPFSTSVEVTTDAAGAGNIRIRYWIVSYVTEGANELPVTPDRQERLVIPPDTPLSELSQKVFSNRNTNLVYKLFDDDPTTGANSFGSTMGAWVINVNLGETVPISRIQLVWGTDTNLDYAPAVIQILKSPDAASWTSVFGPPWSAYPAANTTRPTKPGDVIFNRTFFDGEVTTQWLQIVLRRSWATLGYGHEYGDFIQLGSINIFRKD